MSVGDLAGKTVAQAAKIILMEHVEESMHFSEIAAEMLHRGYRSGRSNPFPATSVASILNTRPSEFENMGGGRFKLVGT